MACNVGTADKIVRYTLAGIAATVVLGFGLSGILAYVLWAFAGIMVVTSLTSFCPIYKVLGINTCARSEHPVRIPVR